MKPQPRYSKDEFARRGDEIYERELRAILEKGNEGQFVAIDIETGAYEVDKDELAASDRLLARFPNAQIWLRRVGSRYAHQFRSRAPVSHLTDEETEFWSQASQPSLARIWDNPEDDVYCQLLKE